MRAVQFVLTNEDNGYRFSEYVMPLADMGLSDDATMGEIYRAAREEMGRPESKVYVDVDSAPPKQVGWFFLKRDRYEDSRDTYLRGAWVTVGEHVPAREEGVSY